MSSKALQNLETIGELRAEAFSRQEFNSLVTSAANSLKDSRIPDLSYAGRFQLLYSAAHSLALAALRRRGYRSGKRYLVFQCLQHTSALNKAEIRMFTLFHERRNLAEYEGALEPDELFLDEISGITERLFELLELQSR